MKVYAFSHTHWDREWFVTAKYTNEWLEELFEELLKLMEKRPGFSFILDGQTLILEDLFSVKPEWRERVLKLVREGRLLVGPVYCQLDWRIAPFQAIWKNFEVGKKDSESYGGTFDIGWFMDNFGQVSQLPQIMWLFGIERAVVWRGVGGEGDTCFLWKAPDGSEVLTLFLIAGYRNLYNLRSTPEIAEKRLKSEIEKEKPFMDFAVLLDGYDLDVHPEDPAEHLKMDFETSLDELFQEVRSRAKKVVEGELLSGKYASVFPGTLSSRTYLKISAEHVGRLLKFRDILAKLFGKSFDNESWRRYLKTLIHDNICGVGVDEIHDGMERAYRELHQGTLREIEEILNSAGVEGHRIISIQPYSFVGKVAGNIGAEVWNVKGAGIWRVEEAGEYEERSPEAFSRKVGSVELVFDGASFFLDGKKVGILCVERENGDAYSSFTTPMDYEELLKSVRVLEADGVVKVLMERELRFHEGYVRTEEEVLLDDLPFLRWRIKMRTLGCCFKVRFGMEGSGEVYAGMPADVVKRPLEDRDLLPRKLSGPLSRVLLAAREVDRVDEFPFQGFVARREGNKTIAILARGLREYKAEEGRFFVTLGRSVEWVTKPVEGRHGDAGPLMYVFGARAEREVVIDIAFMVTDFQPWEEEFLKASEFFRDWVLRVEMRGGEEREIHFGYDKVVLGVDEKGLIFFDPGTKKLLIKQPEKLGKRPCEARILYETFPVSCEGALPSWEAVNVIRKMRKELLKEKEELVKALDRAEGVEYHRVKHRILSMNRTVLELELSELMVRRKMGETISDDEIRRVARRLNDARAARRTYDYILELAEWEETSNKKG